MTVAILPIPGICVGLRDGAKWEFVDGTIVQ